MENTEKIYPYMIMDLENLDGEIWKDVKDYEGYYQVSNYGRIKSLDRIDSRNHKRNGAIMKQKVTDVGYLRVGLRHDSLRTFNVHRLVAQAFLEDFSEELQVNHIDEDKKNNCISNLNMMTAKENTNWGTHNERVSKAKKGVPNPKVSLARKGVPNPKGAEANSKRVGQYDLNNNLIMIYSSTNDAERKGGFNHRIISQCCRGILKHHKGFQWRYI